MSIRIAFTYLLFAVLTGIKPAAATSDVQIQTEWNKLTNDPAFSYRDKKELIQKSPEVENFFNKIMEALATFFTSSTGKVIGWGLFFVLIGWALYMLLVNGGTSLLSRRSKLRNRDQLSAEEELEHADWPKLLQEAIDTKDIRMAIRYSFMQVLQMMQQRELILYRNDKTNYDYYSELKDAHLKQPFRFLSRQYEYAWYGHYEPSPATYSEYMQTFDSLKNKLTIH